MRGPGPWQGRTRAGQAKGGRFPEAEALHSTDKSSQAGRAGVGQAAGRNDELAAGSGAVPAVRAVPAVPLCGVIHIT